MTSSSEPATPGCWRRRMSSTTSLSSTACRASSTLALCRSVAAISFSAAAATTGSRATAAMTSSTAMPGCMSDWCKAMSPAHRSSGRSTMIRTEIPSNSHRDKAHLTSPRLTPLETMSRLCWAATSTLPMSTRQSIEATSPTTRLPISVRTRKGSLPSGKPISSAATTAPTGSGISNGCSSPI